jgi:hypothetical protein
MTGKSGTLKVSCAVSARGWPAQTSQDPWRESEIHTANLHSYEPFRTIWVAESNPVNLVSAMGRDHRKSKAASFLTLSGASGE